MKPHGRYPPPTTITAAQKPLATSEPVADLAFETAVQTKHGHTHIAGLDEAGRGALAGPVVAAAVLLPLDKPEKLALLRDVNDSKQVTARKREAFYDLITAHALAFGVGAVAASEIDEIGIVPSTRRAMQLALAQLPVTPDYLLIDGRIRLAAVNLPQVSIIRGDSLSLSIAAASILAKVTRDRLMVTLSASYPLYGLERHKGYGTAVHLSALSEHGPSRIHRHTFAPIRQSLL